MIEKTSRLLKSIGFDGSIENCIKVVRAERKLIGLEGDKIDSIDESNPFLFVIEI